jgi:hypothetical protein
MEKPWHVKSPWSGEIVEDFSLVAAQSCGEDGVLVNDSRGRAPRTGTRPMTRSATLTCAVLLIGQLNYAKCGSEYRLSSAPTRQKAELTQDEIQRGCAISSTWEDLHMVEIQCPPPSTASAVTTHRYCTDGATIGIFRKKDDVLVNCRIEARKSP